MGIYETNHIYGNYFQQPIGTIQSSNNSSSSAVVKIKFGVGGKYIAIGTSNGTITVYKFKEYYWISCHEIQTNCTTLYDMEWSYDDRYFAYAGNDIQNIIESNTNGIVVDTISWEPIDEYNSMSLQEKIPNHKKNTNVQSLSWSYNGQYLVFGYNNGYIQIRNAMSWTIFKYINCIDFVRGYTKHVYYDT